MPAPLTLTSAKFLIRVIPLTTSLGLIFCSLTIRVPGFCSLKVFLILTGISFSIAGSNALGCIAFAPKIAISIAS